MPGIFKKLSANDIKITPFEAHKTYSTADLSSIGASTDFVYWSPYNKSTFTTGSIKYFQIDKLYYRDYIRERAHRLELDDATYTTQERRLYEYANVISLSQKTFGSEIQPSTFILSCSYSSSEEQFDIRDDGFGNLYDGNRGRDNFPNEDYRILYIGPTQAFKRADLTIDYETGKKYVNNPFLNGYTRTVYDDSYFLNEIEFNNVNFVTSSNSGFYSIKTIPSSLAAYSETESRVDLTALSSSTQLVVSLGEGTLDASSEPFESLFDGVFTDGVQINDIVSANSESLVLTFDPPLKVTQATLRTTTRSTGKYHVRFNSDDNLKQLYTVIDQGVSPGEESSLTFSNLNELNKIEYFFSESLGPGDHFVREIELDTNSILDTRQSKVIIPYQPQFNFETNDDFTINFYYDLNQVDHNNSKVSGDYYILTKEGNKTTPILPSETGKYTSLSATGSSQIGTSPIGGQFPYRIYYKGNHPAANTASLFFERSDGEKIQFVSASFFKSGSTEIQKFVSCKNDNGVLKLKINAETETSSSGQNSPTLNKTVSNKANITLYNKPNPNGSYSNFIGYNGGQISQLMMWNQTLSTVETTNISESIVGTPNIGNIFYDNGFAVITHPSYKNVLNNYDFNGFNSVNSASISSSVLSFDLPNAGAFNNDGTKLVLSSVEHDNIVEFTLNTPYDVTTITTSESIDNSNINYTNIYGLTFNNDGSKFYTIRNNTPQLFSYSLSSSYDLRSAYNKNSSTTTGLGFSIVWSNDGTKLFTTDNNGNINQYITLDPFDIDYLVLDYTYNVGHTGNVTGIRFDNSGYRLFISHRSDLTVTAGYPWSTNTSYITQYVLDRPFELKSLNENNSFNSIDNIYDFGPDGLDWPSDILFNNDGTKAYITLNTVTGGLPGDGEASKIWQFDLPQHINKLEYKNTHLITENEYQCTMTEDEFEFTTNISARKIPFSDNEDIANFATGSDFKPYITSVGLYDDSGNLLVVGKLGQPIKASSETDTTFVIRFDT